MSAVKIGDLVAIIGSVLAVFTTLTTVVLWYVNAEKRKYGLERDFAHMKRSYEQINENLELILREVEHRFNTTERDILEIKSVLNAGRIRPSKDK